MHLLALICTLVLLAMPDCCAARTIEGVVRAVYDGDTLLLSTRTASQLKLRLYGIDAPETAKPGIAGQPYSDPSKRALRGKVLGRQVSAEIVDVDKHQRAVAVIRLNGRDMNREMAAEGMAWAYRQFLHGSYASEYIEAEERARSRRLGLWQEANPLPPWEFRQALKIGVRHSRHR